MGCDGGTIPTRDELVRLKKKPEQKDKTAEMNAKWKSCAISQQALQPPIMACELGRLYSKESVLELLLDRSKFEGNSNFDHIRGLRDVHELILTDNPGYERDQADLGDVYIDHQAARYICPVTGLEMSGKYRFVYLAKCNCVFAERAMKEVKTDICHKCGKTFVTDDVVVLNGTEEDLARMRTNMADRRMKARLEKKAKKKREASATATGSEAAQNGTTSKQPKLEPTAAGPSTVTNGATSAGPTTVTNGATSAGPTTVTKGPTSSKSNGRVKKAKKPTSIQDDPNASLAYKGLFNSCAKARNQTKAHWVTYNPCHY